MNDRILKFADSKQYLGKIARTGENNTRSLAFDCSAALDEYPAAQIIAVIQRPQGDPYTVTPDADGTIRRITLTGYDLEFNGHLQVELRVIDGEKILKSAIYTATVDDSIHGEADAPGQPVRDVLDRLDAEIKQAQAVVDDIRKKLENGEFNGSDAEVTAENIETALGYVPVAPSALAAKQDALTDADMQSITKTGMMTGAAWTSAEQKAARIRMGADGDYVLIEKTVLTEEIVQFNRTQEPDGTPYNLIALKVIVKFIPGQTSGAIFLYGYDSSGNRIVGGASENILMPNADASSAYRSTAVIDIKPLFGMYDCAASQGSQGSPMKITRAPNGDFQLSSTEMKIAEFIFYLYSYGSVPIIAGTEISIYGVRAQ